MALIVELVAALSILLIGFAALMRLLRTSNDDEAAAGRDNAAAWFADAVLNGLRAEATEAATRGEWIDFWSGLQLGSGALTVAAQDMWATPATGLVVRLSPAARPVVFKPYQHHVDTDTPFVDHALWYRLRADVSDRASAVTLHVWPGEAPAVTGREPMRVYTLIWNPEDL